MYHKHHTRGIVLWGRDDGPDSRRINIFTESFGLVSGKVQGSRNLNSKLRSASQDFTLGEFSLVKGKNGWKVVSVRGDSNIFEDLRSSRGKLRAGVNVLNLLKKLAPEEEASPIIFPVVLNFLEFIVEADDDLVIIAECLVLLRVLHNLGYLREDPDFKDHLQVGVIDQTVLEALAIKKQKMIDLINESLRATQMVA